MHALKYSRTPIFRRTEGRQKLSRWQPQMYCWDSFKSKNESAKFGPAKKKIARIKDGDVPQFLLTCFISSYFNLRGIKIETKNK